MKHALVVCICIALLGAALWLRGARSGFAQPEDCVQAFYEAALKGDAATYRACLAVPLQLKYKDEDQERYLRTTMGDVKNWVQTSVARNAAEATIEIEETRRSSRSRLRYRLAEQSGGWIIVEIGTAEDLPTIIPYGTHEKELLPKS